MGAFYGGNGNSLAAAIVFILLDAAWVAVPVLGIFAVGTAVLLGMFLKDKWAKKAPKGKKAK